jgi:hypothetical protein
MAFVVVDVSIFTDVMVKLVVTDLIVSIGLAESVTGPSIFKRHMKTREKRVGKRISV